jgi:Caspase domain
MDGERRALIVAIDEYDHEGLRHLLAPAADARALAEVLGDPQIGGFDVHVVRNEPAHVIQAQVEDLFADSRPDDVLLLHFSCHGLKSESGELFFAARNTRPNRLGSTAIPAAFVQRSMHASRSRSIVLLLDCCYGGAFGQGVVVRASGDVNVLDSFPGGRLGGGRGRAVITASNAMEYAFEGDRLADDKNQQPSVFTNALVEGLATGDADRDEDGWISLNELYEYVFDRVREQTPHQTPSRDIEMQGELYLARSRRRRIHPLPIPADLQAAMIDPNMFTRIGAVSELRTRLISDNLPAAVGAHNALAEMASTDIQYVAEAAAAALREAAIRPMEQELHFGQLIKDSSPARHTIHLLGPPLARTCTFEASAQWIRIQETGEGLDVSVDTSTAGRYRGNIALAGPAGEAVISVDVDVTPSHPQQPPPITKPSPSRGELPTDNFAPASTPIRATQPERPSEQPAPPLPDSASPQPTAPAATTVPRPGTGVPTSFVPGHTPTPQVSRPGERPGIWALSHVLWALIPLLSGGFLTPVPFAHAAVRLRDRRLWLIASAYTAAVVLLIVLLATTTDENGVPGGTTFYWVALIVVGLVHAFLLRARVFAESKPSGWSPKPGP